MTDQLDNFTETAPSDPQNDLYRKVFLILSGFLLFLLPILSFDSGIIDDDVIENEHGIRMMNYYLGKDTIAASSPIDEYGEWILKTRPYDYAVNKNIYGGFFDMTSAFIYKYATSHVMGEYESKHFLCAIAGALLLILIGLIAFRLSGSWTVAILALLFSCLSPRLIGHSFNDPKDIPFATAFTFGLYQIILLLQENLRITWRRALLLIIAIIIAIDIRVGGLMLIVYMLFFSCLLMLYQIAIKKDSLKQYIKPFLFIVIIALASYFGASLFWPWASKNPVMNPIITLRIFSNFNQFNSMELFEGTRINNDAIPWYFAIKWFYISFPVYILIGFFLFLIMGLWHIKDSFTKNYSILVVLFTVVMPLILVMMQKSNLYDDARHLYFVLPSIIVLCALGWYWFFNFLPANFTLPAMILCSLTMLEPFMFMVRNHPHEAMYFSPMIGGEKGAFKKYEMDYWGFSLKSAIKWLDQTDSVWAKDRKTKVRLWYGEQLKLKYYTDKSKHLEYVAAPTASPDWDYWLVLPAESKHNPGMLENWPPANTIHQIVADDVPLCAIVRNPLSSVSIGHGQPMNVASNLNPNDHMGKGMAYYNAKDYNKAIIEFKLVIAADSANVIAYNNIVASLNLLSMYKDAIEVGAKGLKQKPDFTLLKNNLAISEQGIKALKPDEKYYLGESYNYFVQSEFKKCIIAANEILKFNPKSAAAYNNICASNNSLGNFKAAKIAGERALQLAPNDQLVLNNLAVTAKGLKGQ